MEFNIFGRNVGIEHFIFSVCIRFNDLPHFVVQKGVMRKSEKGFHSMKHTSLRTHRIRKIT